MQTYSLHANKLSDRLSLDERDFKLGHCNPKGQYLRNLSYTFEYYLSKAIGYRILNLMIIDMCLKVELVGARYECAIYWLFKI